tara:strand:+ start:859 stop:1092 length:234 start_codon:yes stop_codon:yes gene_type:complete
MYPEDTLINDGGNNIVSFEKDINNPENEGFICFWKMVNFNNNQLIFKKRISKLKAINKLNTLKKKGWKKNYKMTKVA